MIEFRALGEIGLRTLDGAVRHTLLAQPKRLALLAYLAVAIPRGFHRRDKLLALFWPDADGRHAHASLRKALHFLRRALGWDALLSHGDEDIALNDALVWCDVAAFREAVRSDRLEEALILYRGDLLDGLFLRDAPGFERWVDDERERLRAGAARAARRAAELRASQGNYAAATDLARRAMDLDPDEPTLRQLLELLARAGDYVGAIRAYATITRTLATRFAIAPGPETRSLVDRIRAAGGGIATMTWPA